MVHCLPASQLEKNTLSTMVLTMFSEAGIEEKNSNHSLRAAGITPLYQAGVDEKNYSSIIRTSPFSFRIYACL